MRYILALFALLITGSLAASILVVPCNATDLDVGYFYPGECGPAVLNSGYQYIQCDSESMTLYSCQDPFCSQCKISQQQSLSTSCDPTTGGRLMCITGHMDYSKYFGADYVLTGSFGINKLFGMQNATCEDDLNWVRVYKSNKCTVNVNSSGFFSGSQITSCDDVVSSKIYSSSDCSGNPEITINVTPNTCGVSRDGLVEMSVCSAN